MSGIYWLASYPKSGNTWFRAFLANLLVDRDEPLSINELETGAIASSRGWLDEVLGFDTAELSNDEVERLRPYVYRWSLNHNEVGYHKIHDAYSYTSEGQPLISREATRGAIYIVRNPLDVAPSLANHNGCTIDRAIDLLCESKHGLANNKQKHTEQVQQKMLSWSEHVTSWVDAKDLNCHVIRYEDMKMKPLETFTDAAKFLQLNVSSEQIQKAINFSSFELLSKQETEKGFKERPHKSKRFFRRGKMHGWEDDLNDIQARKISENNSIIMRRFGYL